MRLRSVLSWKSIAGQLEIIVLLVICAIWFFLNLDGALGSDEVLKISGTRFLLFGGPVANLNHPPLAKMLIGIGPVFLGETSIGWRVMTPFFALGTIYLTYAIGVMLKDRATGLLASLAVAFTHLFASHAVMAMLDIYLAFFVVLLLFLLLSYFRRTEMSEKHESLYLVAIGAASCAAFLCKYYGVFFAAVAYGLLLWRWRPDRAAEGDSLSTLARHKFYLIGIAVIALIAYLPILIRIGDVIPSLGETEEFISEVAGGNRIVVAGTVYDGAPVWSYLWWLWEFGGWFYLLGLAALVSSLYIGLREREMTSESRTLVVMALVPLICLSLLAVKFPRYLLPLLPILGISSALAIRSGTVSLVKRVSAGRVLSPQASKALSAGLALAVLLIPLSPVYSSAEDPRINTDSGYDIAASIVSGYALMNSNRSVLVYSWYAHVLDYYLEDTYPPNLQLEGLVYSSEQYDELLNGSVDLVVDLENQPRFEHMPAFVLIHESHVTAQRAGGDLFVYFMK